MIIARCIQDLKTHRKAMPGRVAFVPTMGNLHQGHLSLVELAAERADHVIVSVFVNPLQFSQGEDLDQYPRTVDQDLNALSAYPVDLVFIPDEQQLYPNGRAAQTQVSVPWLSTQLCGASRTDFFTGIATVVTKLLQLVQPDVAVFGQKDYQQCLVIQQLVEDLCFDVEVVMAPIVREPDGLAMSSRNHYLTDAERHIAPTLYRMLSTARDDMAQGGDCAQLLEDFQQALPDVFELDYLQLRCAKTLQPISTLSNQRGILLAALMLGKTRLIDNVFVESVGSVCVSD